MTLFDHIDKVRPTRLRANGMYPDIHGSFSYLIVEINNGVLGLQETKNHPNPYTHAQQRMQDYNFQGN